MRVINQTRGTTLMEQGGHARNLWTRTLGLMGRAGLPPGGGLVLDPGGSIHTCFMRFPLDVVFLDRRGKVLRVIERMPPWRVSPIVWGTRYVLELPPGTIAATGTVAGDTVELVR
ncbi:MAG: DUF192 domain-containing protein [Chloroflexi bacterium]|nr:DUF192 domain-containing protein [Chloroflexota bacterium]